MRWILKGSKMDLMGVLKSGQVFRWEIIGEGEALLQYRNEAYRLKEKKDHLEVEGLFGGESLDSIRKLLQWDRDYEALKAALWDYPELKEPIKHCGDIRLLSQGFWECLIAFILSANNNIPRIMGSMEALSVEYGEYLGAYRGKAYYAFPQPKDLAGIDAKELRTRCGTGFRDVRLVTAAQAVLEGEVEEGRLRQMDTAGARKELMTLFGVGPKVADCVLLFGLQKEDVFPVDTWMEKLLLATCGLKSYNRNKLSLWGVNRYKNLAGLAQQYLFYYAKDFWEKE